MCYMFWKSTLNILLHGYDPLIDYSFKLSNFLLETFQVAKKSLTTFVLLKYKRNTRNKQNKYNIMKNYDKGTFSFACLKDALAFTQELPP